MSALAPTPPHPAATNKEAEKRMSGYSRRQSLPLGLALLVALAVSGLLLAFAGKASAALSLEEFDGIAVDRYGSAVTQAAGHPYEASTRFMIGTVPGPSEPAPQESLKEVEVDLPPGFVGNLQNFPACPQQTLRDWQDAFDPCPSDTQVGVVKTYFSNGTEALNPLFNVEPPSGLPALLGFQPLAQTVYLEPRVRSGDHGISVRARNISQAIGVIGTHVVLWGTPVEPSHDPLRGLCLGRPDAIDPNTGQPCSLGSRPAPFVTLPSACNGPQETTIRIRTWQNPGHVETRSFLSHDQLGNPIGMTGCDRVPFDPSIEVAPTVNSADTPSGLSVRLQMPYRNDSQVPEQSPLKRATVTLPEGTTINPASADGLDSCTPAQIGLGSGVAPSCPDASKLGTISIETPLLGTPLQGSVYLASQLDNPFGSTIAMYIVAQGHGVTIKLPGKVETDPATGRVTTTFDDNPQLPFTELELAFAGGPRAPLALPQTCGVKTVTAQFVPWSASNLEDPAARDIVTETASFSVATGPEGKACPASLAARPTDYSLRAGLASSAAGSSSAFALQLTRPDSSQELSQLELDLPAGLTAKLAGVPYCPDATLASISTAQRSGQAQIDNPSCPAASQVGVAEIGVGAGPVPLYVKTAKAYLAGPYKGAPLSLAVVSPAVAGPFDLGTVVVRNRLVVDRDDAQVHVGSDPFPQILYGIPLRLRDIRLSVNREGFMRAPTSCAPRAVATTVTGVNGGVGKPTSRFQVEGCERLAFKPKLALKLSGKTHRSAHPALRATLTMPPGGANIARAQVTLPKTEFLAQEHIRTICTRVQYNAGAGGGKACPKASVYGYAKAWSPLLDKPLEGPVYLRSSSNPLPDLVASLDGQIHIDLAGRIDTKDARIRNTFELVPDAPVSKFVLTMQGGKKGLLVNNTDLCKAKPRADVKFDGQNGKDADSQPLVKVDCGAKRKGKKK